MPRYCHRRLDMTCRLVTWGAMFFLYFSCVACQKKPTIYVAPRDQNASETDERGAEPSDLQSTPVFTPPPSRELIEKAIAMTVRLHGGDPRGEGFDGSGVILGKDDEGILYIMTVSHATKETIHAVEFFSVTSGTPVATVNGPSLVAASDQRDLAILCVRAPSKLAFGAAKLDAVQTSKEVPKVAYSVGCSEGRDPSVLPEGVTGQALIHAEGSERRCRMWITRSPQSVGRSGGELLNDKGRLIGIASLSHDTRGYYVHSSELFVFLNWVQNENVATKGTLDFRRPAAALCQELG